MKKLIGLSVVLVLAICSRAFADLGVTDTASESSAKTEASGLGVTQIYDHPGDVSNGHYVVPVQYNRTSSEGNGTEHDSNDPKNNDIDYIPLDQLKGAKGDTGATGAKGDKGDTGAKGDKGDAGTNGTNGVNGTNGAKGDKGDTGATGATGAKGDKGNTGAAGTNGTNGTNGINGANGANGANGESGSKGDKGDKGNKGDTGLQGVQGVQGEQGVKGDTGEKGDKGDKGIVAKIATPDGNSVTDAASLLFKGDGITGSNGTGVDETVDLSNLKTTQGNTNTTNINNLSNTVNNNTADITNETNQRIAGDNLLQTNINNEATTRKEGDDVLQQNINATNGRVNALDSRVNGLENEVHKLGETKYILGGAVRLFDSRKWQLHAFDNYDTRRKHNDAIGLILGYKLGKSYEEKLIENQQFRTERVNSTVFNPKDEEARRLLAEQARTLKAQQALIADMQAQLNTFKVASEHKALLKLK